MYPLYNEFIPGLPKIKHRTISDLPERYDTYSEQNEKSYSQMTRPETFDKYIRLNNGNPFVTPKKIVILKKETNENFNKSKSDKRRIPGYLSLNFIELYFNCKKYYNGIPDSTVAQIIDFYDYVFPPQNDSSSSSFSDLNSSSSYNDINEN